VINSLAKHRFLRIAGLAVGAVAVTGAAVLVTASAAGYNLSLFRSSNQSTGTTPAAALQQSTNPATLCADFIAHFAGDLKTSQTTVNAAFQLAVGQTLIDEVKNGHITQKQADAINKRIAGQAPCALAGGLKVPAAGAGANSAAYKQALLSAAASALGISGPQLMTDLGQGMTLSQVAAAQKPAVSEAKFRMGLISNLTPLLDKAVAAKQLTSTQEQAIIKRLQTGPIPFWNKPMPNGTAAAKVAPTS
jgi:hypothetical protein